MKLAHSLILFALIAIATIGALPQDCRGTMVFEDDFESYEAGEEPPPIWNAGGVDTDSVQIVDTSLIGKPNLALELKTGRDGTAGAGVFPESVGEIVSYSFDVKHKSPAVSDLYLYLVENIENPGSGLISIFIIGSDGATTFVPNERNGWDSARHCGWVKEGDWQNIKLVYDFSNESVYVSLNGEISPECDLTSKNVASGDAPFEAFIFNLEGQRATSLIDNVRIIQFEAE